MKVHGLILVILSLFCAVFATAQNLPRFDLTMNPKDLFHAKTGIYANPSKKGKAWHRNATLLAPGFSGPIEISIHGDGSRERNPQKSFRIYAKASKGFSFFGNHQTLILRAGFNDSWTHDQRAQQETAIYVKDQVVRDLFRDLGFWSAKSMWAELYINKQYWGLYNITERIDPVTLQSHFGKDSQWEIANDFENLKPEEVDLENFTTYILLNIWLQNYDWPQKNWYAIKSNITKNKWHFTVWDAEYSFGGGSQGFKTDHHTIYHFIKTKSPLRNLFVKLIKDPAYIAYFWQKMEWLLKKYLNANYLVNKLENEALKIKPALPNMIARWAPQQSIRRYDSALNRAKFFTEKRSPYFVRYWRSLLGNPPANFAAELLIGTEPTLWDMLTPWKDYLDYVF